MRKRASKISDETKQEILNQIKQGIKYKVIAANLNISVPAVKSTYYKLVDDRPRKELMPDTPENREMVAQMRLTMTVTQVAEKLGKSNRRINNLTAESPLKHLFVSNLRKAVKSPKLPKTPKVNKKELNPAKTKKDKMETLSTIQKGNPKEKRQVKQFPTKKFDVNNQRHIFIKSKNLTVSVSINDPRSNQEIIDAFELKDIEFLNSCKQNYMNNSHRVKRSQSLSL